MRINDLGFKVEFWVQVLWFIMPGSGLEVWGYTVDAGNPARCLVQKTTEVPYIGVTLRLHYGYIGVILLWNTHE